MKNTKKSLVLSIVTLLLCACMFVGSTFAWFTDTVSNTGNRIQAGTLKVDLLMDKGGEDYESIAGGSGDIFKEADVARNSNETLWEPGKTQFAYLAVENKGNLALKYNIVIDVTDGGLVGSLEYAIISTGHDAPTAVQKAQFTSWDAVKSQAISTGDVASGRTIATSSGVLDEIVNETQNERDYFVLVVHMKEDATNEYQGKDAIIDVYVNATQMTAEEDGFGSNQYDVDTPWMGDLTAIDISESVCEVSNAAELAWVAVQINAGNTLNGKTVKLVKDIDLNGLEWIQINGAGKNITFDGGYTVQENDQNVLKQHAIINLKVSDGHNAGFLATGSGCTVKNLTFDNADVTGVGRAGVVVGHGMCVTVENCTVKNSSVVVEVTNNDDGDKAGAIVGYLSGEPKATVTGCTVENVTVQGYRDIGGIVGYAGGTYTVTNNTITNSTIINDRTNNYKDYTEEPQYDVHEIIGEDTNAGTNVNNNFENVTINKIAPIVVPTGGTVQGAVEATVAAAKAGDILVLPEGDAEIKLPKIPEKITIKGDGDTIVNATGSGSICSVPNGAIIENVIMNVGGSDYHGFYQQGPMEFKDCVFKGMYNVYGNSKFENCTFERLDGYAVKIYGGANIEFNNCHFNGGNRNVYCYQETLGEDRTIKFNDCDFHQTVGNSKSAVMINSCAIDSKNTGFNGHKYILEMNNCSIEDSIRNYTDNGFGGQSQISGEQNEYYFGYFGLKHTNGAGSDYLPIIGTVTIDGDVRYSKEN